jgi:hypothetical protein
LHRFEQEARSASALNHPNIITIHELGQDGSTHYIAMELVEGKTLRDLLVSGLLPMRKAIEIAAQVADGLTKAHEAGITHRDLKPENLMVSHDGFVKILDFGLAKLVSPGWSAVGYVHHLADSGGSGSGNGGIHVTGAGQRRWAGFPVRPVLVRLGALRDGHRKARLSEKHRSGDTGGDSPGTARTDRMQNRDAPAPLCWAIERCLAKEPDKRYVSTRDLARELAAIRDRFSENQLSRWRPARPIFLCSEPGLWGGRRK